MLLLKLFNDESNETRDVSITNQSVLATEPRRSKASAEKDLSLRSLRE